MTSLVVSKDQISFEKTVEGGRNRSNSQAQRTADRLDRLKFEFILSAQLSTAKKQATVSPITKKPATPVTPTPRSKSPSKREVSPDARVKSVQDQVINALKNRLSGSFEPIQDTGQSTSPSKSSTPGLLKRMMSKDEKEVKKTPETPKKVIGDKNVTNRRTGSLFLLELRNKLCSVDLFLPMQYQP